MSAKPEAGTVGWLDLAVPDADRVKDFYSAVVGWTPQGVDMGGYQDWSMAAPGGKVVAGVCHAKGVNAAYAELPPAWMVYFMVPDVAASVETCKANGGAVLIGPKAIGGSQYAVIRDPAGAMCALYQSG